MNVEIWENLIALNSHKDADFKVLEPAAAWVNDEELKEWENEKRLPIKTALKKDIYPLPLPEDREGYFGNRHFSYWMSGLRDRRNLLDACRKYGVKLRSYLDFGCASGRVIRHFAVNDPKVITHGCDINRLHVEWIIRHLPDRIRVFQNHSIPTLPLPDDSIDLVSAFSVFTHIEAFETTWLMELRRIMRKGGIAWITLHTEVTWRDMREDWPLYKALKNHPLFAKLSREEPLPSDRTVFRWHANRSYSSNVFYTTDYIRKAWARYFEILEFRHRFPLYQDVVILRKTD